MEKTKFDIYGCEFGVGMNGGGIARGGAFSENFTEKSLNIKQ